MTKGQPTVSGSTDAIGSNPGESNEEPDAYVLQSARTVTIPADESDSSTGATFGRSRITETQTAASIHDRTNVNACLARLSPDVCSRAAFCNQWRSLPIDPNLESDGF
jgi:hypothetical protein